MCEKCLSKTFSHLGIWWIIFFYFLWVLYIIKIQVTFQNMSWILSSSLILAFHFFQCVFGWTALFIIEQQFFSFTVWYINLYILVTHYTDCYNFITSWNQVVKVFQLCFSFPNCFDCLRSLDFHINFKIIFSVSTNKPDDILIRVILWIV